jgi:hypothetical protein
MAERLTSGHEPRFPKEKTVRRHWVLKGLAFLALGTAAAAALSFLVMTLWNALIPDLFKGPVVGFWQAAGLLLLSKILFGGFRGRHGHHGGRRWMWRQRWERMSPEERERFRNGFGRWNKMTREERAEFRKGFRGCGGGPSRGAMAGCGMSSGGGPGDEWMEKEV